MDLAGLTVTSPTKYECKSKQSKAKTFLKPYWSDLLQQKWDAASKKEKLWLKCSDHTNIKRKLKQEYCIARNDFDKHLRKAKRTYQNTLQMDLLTELEKPNSRDFWKQIGKIGISNDRRDQIPWEVIDDTGEVITDKECVLQKWKTDYQTLFNDQTDSMLYDECHLDRIKKGEISSDPELVETSCLNEPITRCEVEKAVSRLKLRKAAGIDNIPAEVLKNKTCIDMLQKIINFCFENGVSPFEWKQGIINPIVKPNSTDVRLPLSYRGITLLSVPCKVYCDILNSRFGDWIEDSGVLVDEQCGFRRKRSCLDQIYSLYSIINDQKMKVTQILLLIIISFGLPVSLQDQRSGSKLRTDVTTESGSMIVSSTSVVSRQTETSQMRTNERESRYETTDSGMQTSTYPDIFGDVCFEKGGCPTQETLNENGWFCNCDSDCGHYNDCCLQHNSTAKNVHHIHQCIKIKTDDKSIIGFQTISWCPLKYENKYVQDKCLVNNLLETGPPVVVGKNFVFKNKYCALCNDVKTYIPFDVIFYDVKMTSGEYDYFQNQTTKSKLSFISMHADYKLEPPPNIDLRICPANLIENSQPLCQTYINPILIPVGRDYRLYRNEFCMPDQEKQKSFFCLANLMRTLWRVNEIHSLSVIFSFKEPKLMTESRNECQKWSEEVEKSNLCVHLETYTNYEIHLEYNMVSTKNHTKEELIAIGLVSVWTHMVTNFSQCSGYFRMDESENKMMVKVSISLQVLKRSFSNEIPVIEKSFRDHRIDIVMKDYDTEEITMIKKRNPISSAKDDSQRFNKIFFKPIVPDQKEVFLKYLLSATNINITVQNDKFCSHQKVAIDITPDGGLYIDSDAIRCDESKQMSESTISILHLSKLAIVTYVCFSVSIISLAIFIVFNRKHKYHNSIPGSNMENLSTSLLLANILFLFGIGASKIYIICYVFGIILQYLWLTVFTYMTIAVAHIVFSLSQIKYRSSIPSEDAHKRRTVTLVGLLIPLLIVVPAIVIDQFGPEYWSLGYGGSECFPNQYPANIVFFSGPVVFAVGVDFVCMLHSIIHICRIRLTMRSMRKLNVYEDAQIYLRIVVLSGVFWMTGILAAVFDSEWIDYVFTILCGLQGLCVAVANLTTGRVLKAKRLPSNDRDIKT
ncbi:unnamed protein product [Mytilus coruscus]|uniref:G-protein coupled receptors family 2 profile 2 domain-containing protein n=1 Tax=Mytilus coruscus TaxID=42192 RepID=A0A6J8E4J1_MYTCO|nr:unnamed protein product [Mytilus coruscus]